MNDVKLDKKCMPRFPLGQTVMTPGVVEHIPQEEVWAALGRHQCGDWGRVCKEDWSENELSLEQGFRLLSVYESNGGEHFWIITEADRSATTILLPDEY